MLFEDVFIKQWLFSPLTWLKYFLPPISGVSWAVTSCLGKNLSSRLEKYHNWWLPLPCSNGGSLRHHLDSSLGFKPFRKSGEKTQLTRWGEGSWNALKSPLFTMTYVLSIWGLIVELLPTKTLFSMLNYKLLPWGLVIVSYWVASSDFSRCEFLTTENRGKASDKMKVCEVEVQTLGFDDRIWNLCLHPRNLT